ncbi:MAG: hypothetical protein RSB70_04210 [Clostridium sp.]
MNVMLLTDVYVNLRSVYQGTIKATVNIPKGMKVLVTEAKYMELSLLHVSLKADFFMCF